LRFPVEAVRQWLDAQTVKPAPAVTPGRELSAGFQAISEANGNGAAGRAANGRQGGA
jgi:hypothetical protein